MRPPVFGIAGWKNSGKTTMTARLVTELTGRGYAIAAIKHAHESFDIDHPGRDSYRLREAGARRVVLSSPKRWALMHELGDSPEMSFKDVLSKAGTCDLILVEGFKREPFPKIELRREGSASRQPLTGVPEIVAVASDRPDDETESIPIFHLDDIRGISDFITRHLNLTPR
jgi:molybdopterin-guanine dinucleotide biosynthesis protein B